jgi:hypothetical protein
MPNIHWVARQNKLETPKEKDEVNKQLHLRSPKPLLALLFWVCSISLKTVSVRFEFCKMVLLRGEGVVNYRKSYAVSQLTKIPTFRTEQKIHRWIALLRGYPQMFFSFKSKCWDFR